MLGAYAYLIELWGQPPLGDADRNNDGRVDEGEMQAWLDTELTGEGWIAPKPFKHPDLGDIWIGGSARKHTGRTPPAPYMETEALKQTHFVLYSASQFPKVEIDRVTLTPATGDLFWIDVTVKNDRVYPTSSDRALQLKRAAKDRMTLAFSPSVSFVEVPAGVVRLDPLNEQTATTALDVQDGRIPAARPRLGAVPRAGPNDRLGRLGGGEDGVEVRGDRHQANRDQGVGRVAT